MIHSPKTPKQYEWSQESVNTFWDLLSHSPLNALSFSKLAKHQLVAFVQSVRMAPCTLLDFGAGDGDLAEALIQCGYRVAIYEPSEERWQNFLHSSFAQHPNFLGRVTSCDKKQFDIVCAFEVLEHILPDTLDKNMALLFSFVNNDGIFIGSVPAEEDLGMASCICPECYHIFHRFQHLRSFTHDSLLQFLKKFGFTYQWVGVARFCASFLFVASPVPLSLHVSFNDNPKNLQQALLDSYSAYTQMRVQVQAQIQKYDCMIGDIPKECLKPLYGCSLFSRALKKLLRIISVCFYKLP